MTLPIKNILASLIVAALVGCSSNIQPVGDLGPNKLKVYVIKNSDFLSASRMLVILDKKGNVTAYSGSTVAGAGTIGMQAVDTVASAGALVVGAKAIEHGLENSKISGIPHSLTVKTNSTIDVSGHLKD